MEALHVLLVEDDAAIRAMLRGALQLAGYQVSEAGQRQQAWQYLQHPPEAPADIVLLDLGLPPATHDSSEGIKLLRQIMLDCLDLKVIVLTGQDQESAALEAIKEGAFDFLAKPASSVQILQALQRAALFLRKERELQMAGVTRIAINANAGEGLKNVRDDAEEKLVRQVLKETGFNLHQSARKLGVKRENLYYFLKKFGIQRDDGASAPPEQS
ncbi:response regulator [Massilia sp. W12]|uniref:response regulator n=1 Tax=Massilia sp. W12 TaxID=3126507 RepID=UPI0030D3E27F